MKKFKKMLLLFVIIAFFTYVKDVQAYNSIGYKWNKKNIVYYYYPDSFYSVGASAWNGLNAKFTYGATYYDVNCLTVSSPNADWDGISYVGCDSMYITNVVININSAATATWNNSNALKSVVCHEFGHALGLDENGSSKTIMNDHTWGDDSRYGTYKLTTPQEDDKKFVNTVY